MHEAHDALTCIGTKTYINEKNRVKYSDQHYFKTDNEVYFIGGQSIDKKNKLKSKNNNEVIKYDFNTKIFENLGNLNFH